MFRFAPSQPPCPSSPRPHPVCVASLSLAGGVRSLPPRFPPRRSLLRPHPHSIRIRNRLQDPPSDRGRQEGGSIFLLCHWINIRCQESLRIPKESQRILPFSPTLPPPPTHASQWAGNELNDSIETCIEARRRQRRQRRQRRRHPQGINKYQRMLHHREMIKRDKSAHRWVPGVGDVAGVASVAQVLTNS